MAPEGIERWRWSEKSDVWAWPLTTWEMFPHGRVPHTFIANVAEVGQRVVAGTRLERPQEPAESPDRVFEILHRCRAAEAADRPVFLGVKRLLGEEVEKEMQGEYCLRLFAEAGGARIAGAGPSRCA